MIVVQRVKTERSVKMVNHNFAPIRGRISERPQDKTETPKISVTIGRFVLPQHNYTHVDKYKYKEREINPLETYVNTIESNPKNIGRGTIVQPEALMLRAVTPYIFDQLYEGWAQGRRLTNATQRSKKRNIRAIVSDVSQVFAQQMQQDVAFKKDSLNVGKRFRANMYEPDVEYYDYDHENDSAYCGSGPVHLRLSKRLSNSDDDRLSVGIRGLDDLDNRRVISDDVKRINLALRAVGLLSCAAPQLRIENLEFDIPVFTPDKEAQAEGREPFFPAVPLGLVEFQPLVIHETN